MANATMDLCRNSPVIEQIVEEIVSSDYNKLPVGYDSFKMNDDVNQAQAQGKSLRKKGKLAMMMQSENDGETANTTNKLVCISIVI